VANSYITVHDYLRAVTGQATSRLLGNLMRVGSPGVSPGATSLPVTPATTVSLAQYDQVYIFDGASSEIVTVTANTSEPASSIPISATQFAHAAGVSCCSDGASGSLGQTIFDASAEVETICRQVLLQQSNANEQLPLVTTRAWIDSALQLAIRPRQFPVQSVSAIALLLPGAAVLNLDLSNLQQSSIARIVTLSTIKVISGNGNTLPFSSRIDGTTQGFAQISYVAGYAYSALPDIIRRAAILLTSDILSDQRNPTGAASVQMGKRHVEAFLRGDTSGESALVKRARKWLRPYTQDVL
jgi:hypothetical protein